MNKEGRRKRGKKIKQKENGVDQKEKTCFESCDSGKKC